MSRVLLPAVQRAGLPRCFRSEGLGGVRIGLAMHRRASRLEVLAAKSLKTGVGCCYSVRRSGLSYIAAAGALKRWRPFR